MQPDILYDPAVRGARVISPAEAAAILQCGKTRITELISKGALRSYRDGHMRKVFLFSVLAYQAALAAQKPAPNPNPEPSKRRVTR